MDVDKKCSRCVGAILFTIQLRVSCSPQSDKPVKIPQDVAAQTKPFLWGKNEGATTGFKWSSGANVKCVNPSIMRNSDGDEEAMVGMENNCRTVMQ
eukprot:SAG31_NODE_532_length_14374_cov_30.565254_2_plen_96_part_00